MIISFERLNDTGVEVLKPVIFRTTLRDINLKTQTGPKVNFSFIHLVPRYAENARVKADSLLFFNDLDLPLHLVRIVCYILSISLLVLAGIPCTDTGEGFAHEELQHSVAEDSCNGKESRNCSDQETDTCSPLCPCACTGCHGFSLSILFSCPIPAPVYLLLNTSELEVSQYQGYHPAIWQPPQQFI